MKPKSLLTTQSSHPAKLNKLFDYHKDSSHALTLLMAKARRQSSEIKFLRRLLHGNLQTIRVIQCLANDAPSFNDRQDN